MRTKISLFTWVGLFISLFGFIALRLTFRALGVSNSIPADLCRELVIWIMAALLILLIRRGEKLPLSSIRLGVEPWRQSVRFGCIHAGLCGVTAWIVIMFTGYGHGPGSAEFNKMPIWFETVAVIRAGIVEELFFRGYAIERLESICWWPISVRGNSIVDFCGNALDWRNPEHHHRIRGWGRANPILSVAARPGSEHDRARPKRLSRAGVTALLSLTAQEARERGKS